MKKIFVTGATGFVGQNLVPKLVTEGFSITCLARDPQPSLFASFPQITWVEGDILHSKNKLEPLLTHHDRVYHLAGLVGYKPSLRQALFDINVGGTENILEAAINAGVQEFVHMSSVAAIGSSFSPHQILNEESPYNLQGLGLGYFDSKHEAEKKVIKISEHHSLQTFILNPSTIYGPGDFQKGSRSTQLKVARGEFPFSPPGGANVVHIQDVIQACLQVPSLGKKNRRYIIASENLLLQEVFSLIATFAKVKPPSITLPKEFLYILGASSDGVSRLFSFLKGKPQNSSLSLENARVACYYHWFSNQRAQKELGLKFRSSQEAIRDSVQSLLCTSSRQTR
jgi:dihydroflavonol-4-reductase